MKTKLPFIITIALFILYTALDNYGYQSYTMLFQAFGWLTLTLTILLNILISLISGYSVHLALSQLPIKNSGSSMSIGAIGNSIAAVFAGCASCGVNILAAIGISFALPVITPGAIEYKLLALVIVLIGYAIISYRIKHSVCEVKL